MAAEKLFYRIKKGDTLAFEELFEQLYPSMCVVAKSYVKDEDIAEDIAQEAFIKLWNNRESYDDISSLKSFLYVMVKNISLNRIKKEEQGRKYEEEVDKAFEKDISHKIIEEESYRIIYQAVNALPEQSRNIMNLSLRGMQNQEIATNLGVSINTVKTLKYNALKTLRITLKDYYFLLALLLKEF
ncbi:MULTISPECIES: RNA polymerase sigma-70 factor [unclassified Saccharicrinis]|uniref:RNA polymerase sigma-70 factor n=1 Tax=unclassified Saccharicrinis TaxID=2646859 RepID=UPI003D33802D